MKLKLILPAGAVPNQSKVTKPTGDKVYTLVHELKIHGIDQKIDNQGVKFLIDQAGNITAISNDVLVGKIFESFIGLHEFTEDAIAEFGDLEDDEE